MAKDFIQAEWDLDTFLELYASFLHRSRKRQGNALAELLELADKNPEPIKVSPLDLLKKLVPPLAYDSGAPLLFYSLAEFNTPAADEALKEILREPGQVRNEDFKKFIEIAISEGKQDLLKVLEQKTLSREKREILRRMLKKKEHQDAQ